jgi:hypothetical protein
MVTKQELETLVKESVSKSEVCRKLGLPPGGSSFRKIRQLILDFNINIEHFSQDASNNKFNRKYALVNKHCPVCNTVFQARKGHKRQKVTCSRSCSNTYFRSGENNPNWKSEKSEWGYRKVCFSKWKKQCIICGFDKVVEVHHLDENHNNDSENNLVPLCPNHHKMIHTKKYGTAIKTEVLEKLSESSS